MGFFLRIKNALSQEEGPFNEISNSASDWILSEGEKVAIADLEKRLVDAAGSDLQLLTLYALLPDLIPGIIGALPEGDLPGSEDEENKERKKESKENYSKHD